MPSKMASERLDILANQKAQLESYVNSLKENGQILTSIKSQVGFVEQNFSDLLKGWNNATNAMRKRFLRRAIRRIIITKEEMLSTF